MNEKVTNEEMLPTKELLKRKRKAAYEAEKQRRKEERKREKEQLRASQQEERTARDQDLWAQLSKGSAVESKNKKVPPH